MDEFTRVVPNKAPWCVMYTNDVVLIDENTNTLEVFEMYLEREREVLEKN